MWHMISDTWINDPFVKRYIWWWCSLSKIVLACGWETIEEKWYDIWLVTPESTIHLSEDIFDDAMSWDCKTMLACAWEIINFWSLISFVNNSLTTSSTRQNAMMKNWTTQTFKIITQGHKKFNQMLIIIPYK